MTIGTKNFGLRITRGRCARNGVFHDNQPCIFLLFRGRRL